MLLITQATYSVLRELLADTLVLSPTHGGTGHALTTSSLYSFLCQHAEGHTGDVEHLLPVFNALQRILQEADATQGPAVVQRMFVLLDSLQAKCEQDFVEGRYEESALAMQSMAVWMRRCILDPAMGRDHPHLVAMVLHRMYKYSVLEANADCGTSSAAGSLLSTTTEAPGARSRLRQLATAARDGAATANTKVRRSNAKLLQGDTATLWQRAYAELPTPPGHTCASLVPILLAWQQEVVATQHAARKAAAATVAVPPSTGMRVLPSSASDVTSTHHSLVTVPEEDVAHSDEEGVLECPRRASAQSSPRDDRSDSSSGSLEAVERAPPVRQDKVHLRAPPVRQDKVHLRALHVDARSAHAEYEAFKRNL